MKKLIYTILAVSIIFISCKKDEETNPSTGNNDTTETDNDAVNNIVGVWSTKSVDVEMSMSVIEGSQVVEEMDTSYTMLPGDEGFEFPDNIEFTAGGKFIAGSDLVGSYTYSDNLLSITEEDEEEQTWECVVTATSFKMTLEDSDEWADEYGSYSNSYKMTINAER